MNKATASRLDLAEVCPGSHSLQWTRDTSEAGTNGTNRHAFVERSAKGDRSGAVELLPEAIRECMEKVDLDKLFALFPTHPRSEVPVAYDPIKDTARELPQTNGHRDYSSVKPGEIPGTIDLLSVGDECVVVADLKTGQGYVTHARDSRQLQFAAVASAKIHGKRSAVGAILKVEEDGSIRLLSASWDDMDLDGFAHELGEIYRAVHAKEPRFAVGPHCAWCPARTRCPEVVNAAQSLVPIGKRASELTDEALVAAWRAWKAVKPLGAGIEDEARRRAKVGRLPLDDKKALAIVVSTRRTPNLKAAIGLAASVGADPQQVIAAGTLARANLVTTIGEAKTDALLAAIENENGMSVTTFDTLREVNHPRGGK